MSKQTPWDELRRLKDINQIFDLVCAGNYFAGQFDTKMPVDESRKAFKRIKDLMTWHFTKLITECKEEWIEEAAKVAEKHWTEKSIGKGDVKYEEGWTDGAEQIAREIRALKGERYDRK